MSNTERIRELNDQLRATGTGGKIILTQGVLAQGEETVRQVLLAMKHYTAFHPDNDPYGEHDFGAIEYQGKKYFWKIDYYDHSFTMHSPDAADPTVTCRVLTLMLAEEY